MVNQKTSSLVGPQKTLMQKYDQLDKDTKKNLESLYRKTLSNLDKIESYQQETSRFIKAALESPARTNEIKQILGAAKGIISLDDKLSRVEFQAAHTVKEMGSKLQT